MTTRSLVLPGRRRSARLDNGLEVRVVERPGSGVVSTVLWLRVGSADEATGKGGLAHFVEHMMFRGSQHYGSGEIDRITLALGGDNNAFTSHDATAYYFRFAADCWRQALTLEADRMAGLCFEDRHLASERQVVLEEISLYENEPWEALESHVLSCFYGDHSYGRPILGPREEVAAFEASDVLDFHRRYYRPSNAVLTVAGEVSLEEVMSAAAPLSGLKSAGPALRRRPAPDPPAGLHRVQRQHGEIDRMLLALPGFAVSDPRHPALRLLACVLTLGRSSRLHRELVERRRICQWISAEVAELETGGHWALALEAMPGVEPEKVEEALLGELEALAAEPPTLDEVARAQRMLVADWLFGCEKVHSQALVVAHEESFLGPGWSERTIGRIGAMTAGELADLIAELELENSLERRAVLGWSFADERT